MIARLSRISEYFKVIVSNKLWNYFIVLLIAINTIVLSMETYPSVMNTYGDLLKYLDQKILMIFIIELIIRFVAYKWGFFKNPWSLFDLCVISLALVPSQDAFAALRAARALRVLRLISIFPKLCGVIEGLVRAIPGICAIAGVMSVIICVFGLIASKLYGSSFPEWFGNFHLSIFSLFQIMTLEGWPDIVRAVMQEKPLAWIFFITYILVATFSVLNLFIAVVVDAMQRNHAIDIESEDDDKIECMNKKLDIIISKIK